MAQRPGRREHPHCPGAGPVRFSPTPLALRLKPGKVPEVIGTGRKRRFKIDLVRKTLEP
jgi:hypothetical protein